MPSFYFFYANDHILNEVYSVLQGSSPPVDPRLGAITNSFFHLSMICARRGGAEVAG